MHPSSSSAAEGPDERLSTADRTAIAADLKAAALRLGFSRVGIASAAPPPHHATFRDWLSRGLAGPMQEWLARHEPLRRDPDPLLPGVRSVVMLATDHAAPPVAPSRPGHGRLARYAWGGDYHDLLRNRTNELVAWFESRVPGCRGRGFVDSVPFAERDYAWLAGLGWIGKNTMLIDQRTGSYFLLAAVLLDLTLPTDEPLATDHCGTCTACLDACPTQAFVEPRVLDAARCISGLTIEHRGTVPEPLRTGLGDWIFGCDVCQDVCPWNRAPPGSTEPAFQDRHGTGGTLPLADLLGLDEAGFRQRFRGTPLVRPKRQGLLRSAAIALGNRPDADSCGALVAALGDADAVVRGAAAWALGRWRLVADPPLAATATAALHARRADEPDAAVRDEIAAALAVERPRETPQAPAGESTPAVQSDVVSSTSAAGSRPGPSAS